MKVALIATPTRTYAPNTIMPLGVMYLAAYLEQIGHTVKIIDVARTRQSNRATITELMEFKPELIGISGIATAYRFIKCLVPKLKKTFRKIPVVIGGHIVLDNSMNLLYTVGADYTIESYGEKALGYLVQHLEGKRELEDIPGLSYLRNGKMIKNPGLAFFDNINDIPLPTYHKIDMEYYLTVFKTIPKLQRYLTKSGKTPPPMRWTPITAGRGCTDKCSFCVHEFAHKGLYTHSIEYIENHVSLLYNEYNARIFAFGEDLFLYNAKQARELANMMSINFPDAYFSCTSRADYITSEIIDILKDSNCFYVVYGFESGSNNMLKILRKRMTRDVNIKAYKTVAGTNITPACSFMVGTPGETKKTVEETISAIKEAGITDSAVFFTTPYPGSRLFRWCLEQGIIVDGEAYLNFISNRDASRLSINFTAYPDIIVKMMRFLILNALEKNKLKTDKYYKIPIKRLIVKHWIIPLLYKFYFFLHRIMVKAKPGYKEDVINLKFNEDPALMLSTDGK